MMLTGEQSRREKLQSMYRAWPFEYAALDMALSMLGGDHSLLREACLMALNHKLPLVDAAGRQRDINTARQQRAAAYQAKKAIK